VRHRCANPAADWSRRGAERHRSRQFLLISYSFETKLGNFMEIAFISRPLAARIAGCSAALVASMASAGPAAALVASMASAGPSAALDYKFLFNKTPGYRLGTMHPDGSVTYS
jgi:hypothetical protein